MTGRRFKPGESVDFVVVGTGAAGGVMARELARTGFTVLALEQGPRLTAADFRHDELDYWFNNGLINKLDTNPQTFRKTPEEVAQRVEDGLPPAWYAPLVGGSSTHFTANYWRFHENDFRERSLLGAIPGTSFADWPLDYAELEPYYTRVEWEIGVSGLAGASPFDPPRSRPYPMPPLPVKSSGVLFERGARKLGLHPFPAPMAIASVPYRGRAACAHCGFCMGYGCEMQAKSSTLYNMIPEAEATGRCEVRSRSYVSRIELDAKGRTTGVAYFDAEKREHFQKARAVVLCANGAESARLLLLSASARFPEGLANSSGLVGRNLMFNGYAEVHAIFEHELNEYKSVQVTRVAHDFYEHDPKRGFYGGGGLDSRIGPLPIGWALLAPPPQRSWGPQYKALIEAMPRAMVVASHTTSLPLDTNRVDLDPTLKDAWGLPAMRVTYRDHADDLKMCAFLQDRAVEIMHAAGAQQVWKADLGESTASPHLLGTCRMGNDPRTSVVDRHHRTHDVRNLFICDGSSFVTSGRGQPTMTIQALAFRAAEGIARFARRGEV
ncbi:MAG TPA: GMC family oxidoreductase [Steroidobacteraceae bacterium]|nr:GMC family oxidoreductase [Steroidobacteraceae bacterium]